MSMTNVTCLRFVDKCILVILCVVALGGATAWGATFGHAPTVDNYSESIEGIIKGMRATLSEAGVATSITANISNTSVAKRARAMLYRCSDTSLVAATEMKIIPVADADVTFNFNHTVNLAADDYYIVVYAQSTSGLCFLGDYSGTAGSVFSCRDVEVITSYVPPLLIRPIGDANFIEYRIFCTYTAGSTLTFGNSSAVHGSSLVALKEQIVGGIFTTPASTVSVTSITPFIQLSAAAGEIDTVKCLLYKGSDLSYVDSTYSILFYGDTAVTGAIQLRRKFTFPTAKTLPASTDYVFCVWGGHFSTSANLAHDLGGGNGLETDDVQPFDGTPPDPLQDATVASRLASTFMDYTVVPSVKPRRRKIMLGQPLGMVREATETFAGNRDEILY